MTPQTISLTIEKLMNTAVGLQLMLIDHYVWHSQHVVIQICQSFSSESANTSSNYYLVINFGNQS